MNSFVSQLVQLWSQFNLNQKISILLSASVIVLGMVALLVWSSQPDLKLLYGRLSSDDMSMVVSKVEEMGVEYKVDGGGSSIYVPADQVYALRMSLSAEGVPSGGGVGFEIFDKGNFGISDFHQRTNYNRAVQGELARTIGQLQGVRHARVMIVVPETRLLIAKGENNQATASVFVETNGALSMSGVNSIRFLVANAVEGLMVDKVAVIDERGNVLSESLVGGSSLNMAGGQMRFRESLERYYTQQVEGLISRVVGAQNVVARVSVDVDTDSITTLEESYDPNSKVTLTETKTNDSLESQESGPGGAVGVAANVGEGGAGGGTQNVTSEKRSNATSNYAYNRVTRESSKTPGEIRRISASVFVAMRMRKEGEGEELRSVPQPRTPEEINDLYEIVGNALGVPLVEGRPENVTIKEIEFVEEPALQAGGFMDVPNTLTGWTSVLDNYLVIGLAVIIFVVFLKMVKQQRPSNFALEILNQTNDKRAAESAMDVTPRPTPELLNELIKQKPENISSALQSWATKEEN